MKLHLVFALCSALALTGCGGTSVFTQASISQAAPEALTQAEKALSIAHLAYNSVGQLLIDSAKSGVLKGANAAQAKVYFDKAGDALSVADQADKVANAQGILDAVKTANDAIISAKSLIGA